MGWSALHSERRPGSAAEPECREPVLRIGPPGVLLRQCLQRAADLRHPAWVGPAQPFDFGELVARVRALSRRAHRPAATVLRSGSITLDDTRHEVSVEGRQLELTPKEFAVLRLLLAARGAAVQHDELVRTVWDEYLDPRTGAVRATVSRLRGKLGDPGVIVADRQGGYRLCD